MLVDHPQWLFIRYVSWSTPLALTSRFINVGFKVDKLVFSWIITGNWCLYYQLNLLRLEQLNTLN